MRMVGVETLWRILTKTTVVCGVERVSCRGCHVSRVWETTVGWVRGSVSCVRIPRCSLKQWLLTLQAMIENLTWCLASTIITVLQICLLIVTWWGVTGAQTESGATETELVGEHIPDNKSMSEIRDGGTVYLIQDWTHTCVQDSWNCSTEMV